MSVRWCAMRTQGAAALALGCAVQLGFQPDLSYIGVLLISYPLREIKIREIGEVRVPNISMRQPICENL